MFFKNTENIRDFRELSICSYIRGWWSAQLISIENYPSGVTLTEAAASFA